MSETPVRRTSLHAEHLKLGARMVPFAGWEMPIQYTGIVDEHNACRNAAGLFDVSHMGELELSGPLAGEVVNERITNDASKLQVGQALYTCCCQESGTVLDDLIIYRAGEEAWMIVCNASNRDKIVGVFEAAAKGRCDFRDRSDVTALVALQGPKAFEILDRTGGDSRKIRDLKPFGFCDAIVCNVRTTVARTGYTGEDGVEIFVAWEDAPALWSQLLALGADLGLKAVGLGARDTLRMEAKLPLYGQEIDETIHPLEAGLGWVVKLDKGEFVGRSALAAAKEQGLTRKCIGFEMVGRGIARHGYELLNEAGEVMGICTSGSPSPSTGKNIGIGYLPVALSAIGTKFLVNCRGKHIEAVVVKTPFITKKRPSSTSV
jgi:aminomethyltransferase